METQSSGFRKRGCRNGAASDVFLSFRFLQIFSLFSFRFLPFFFVFWFLPFVPFLSFFFFFGFLPFFSVSFRFFPFFFFCVFAVFAAFSGSDFSVSFLVRYRETFCETPKFGTGSEVRYGGSKTLQKVRGNARFPMEMHIIEIQTVTIVQHYRSSKTLQIRAVFGTEESFGHLAVVNKASRSTSLYMQ